MSSARGSINCVFPLEQFERHFSRVFTMSNLSKLEFVALDITGNNYLSWVLDAEIHLETKGLGDTIKQGNKSSSQGYDKPERRQNNYRGRDHGRGSGRGRERGRHNYRQHGKNKQETNKGSQNNPSTGKVNMCHRCGMKGHWARICRTPDHFVKLYQGSLKGRENNVEAHLTFHNNDDEAAPSNKHDDIKENLAYKDDDFKSLSNITHLEAGDFYDDID
ncbi:uncharacterized protein LOC132633806 isoform X2 [Lycium barbarum]|uniref:uncharacterized protein LOC132633806 isoform X2 n=1 Tax=Lycium barbarum TaxID=112863 RepID=UPI00293F5B2E|nr:uncharacterized protein LOC132633806 isoform X2 [Lycium barbarum]